MHTLIRAAVLAAFFVSASTAPAQSQCGPREILLRQLAERYEEAPEGAGAEGRIGTFLPWQALENDIANSIYVSSR